MDAMPMDEREMRRHPAEMRSEVDALQQTINPRPADRRLLAAAKAALAELLRLGATDNDDTVGPNEVVMELRKAIAAAEKATG
jgi:hypothetical protein